MGAWPKAHAQEVRGAHQGYDPSQTGEVITDDTLEQPELVVSQQARGEALLTRIANALENIAQELVYLNESRFPRGH